MGVIFSGGIFIGLLLLIVGVIGLIFSFTNLVMGSPAMVQGGLTFGTFTTIGLAILILLLIASPEFE
jgi:hypothetical protein